MSSSYKGPDFTSRYKSELAAISGNYVSLSPDSSARNTIQATLSTYTPLIVKAATSQTANLQEWQNVSGTPLAYIDLDGHFSTTRGITVNGNGGVYDLLGSFAGGGSAKLQYTDNGERLWWRGQGGYLVRFNNYAPSVTFHSGIAFNVTGVTIYRQLNNETFLMSPAANILAMRNSTSAQAFYIYNTYTSDTTYERAVFDWQNTANTLTIGVQASGIPATTTAGRSININAGDALFGTTGAGNGGSITLQSGNGALSGSGVANGGDITLKGGTPKTSDGGGRGGNITIEGGSGFNTNGGRTDQAGNVYVYGGSNASAGQSGRVFIGSGAAVDASASPGVTIYTGKGVETTSTPGISIYTGNTTGNTAIPGNILIRAGAANWTSSTPTTVPGASLTLQTQRGRTQQSGQGLLVASDGGSLLNNVGPGGPADGADASGNTGGIGGSYTVTGGAGGDSTGSGTTHTGGKGSTLTLKSGNGGSATGESGNRYGGDSGDIILSIGSAGTGATANGTTGSIYLSGNTTVTQNLTAVELIAQTAITLPYLSGAEDSIITVDSNGLLQRSSVLIRNISGSDLFNVTEFTTDPLSSELVTGDLWITDSPSTSGKLLKFWDGTYKYSVELSRE